MNSRWIITACFAVFILGTAGTSATAQTRLDIRLEGPWIVYTDTTLAAWPVLVAISAGGVSNENDNTYFHSIHVTVGDGYPIESPGVYCLTFDLACGKKGAAALNPDGYPSRVLPLSVKAPASWDWASKYKSPYYATAIILPMPDSFSTDGTWYMRFGKSFDASGKTYTRKEQHSVGLQLHYDSGPTSFNLQKCTPPVDLGKCPYVTDIPANTALPNTGTLSIAMKSPDNDNPCDPHVRRAHPKTLALLEANNNQDIAIIDPAIGSNAAGIPIYDKDGGVNDGCLDNDPQSKANAATAMSDMGQQWAGQLAAISEFIREYKDPESHKSKDPRLGDKGLLLLQIQDASNKDNLNTSFPRFSQLRLVETLVSTSESRAEALLLEGANKSRNAQPNQTQNQLTNGSNGQLTLAQLLSLEKGFLAANPPTKNGNDCKAAIMLVQ